MINVDIILCMNYLGFQRNFAHFISLSIILLCSIKYISILHIADSMASLYCLAVHHDYLAC